MPEPVAKHKVSGKFNVRLPKDLHRALLVRAAREGTSLNQMVLTLVSRGV